jgi:hypothetical protein
VRHLWTATALLALLVATRGSAAETAAQATVTVEVTNHTANGTTVAGDEVTLLLYKGQELTVSLSARVGQDGKAVFENVPTGEDVAAVARAKHQNMAFNSQVVPLATAGAVSADVQVFDVSTDTSKLSVGTHHIMVAVRSTSLEFTEYMQLSNPSDMAITGPARDDRNRPVVIAVGLPKGFKDLTASSYLEEEAMVVTADGFYDTLAVPPGEHQVTFSYKLDIDRRTIDVARKITLPTSELMIFWEQGQGRLEGLGEPSGKLTNAEGVPIEYYRRANLKPGEAISFQISGFNVKHSDSYTWIVLAAVFAAVVVIALLRSRPKPAKRGQRDA